MGAPALVFSVLVVLGGTELYTRHNAVHCGGGLGWLGPGFAFYGMLALALLTTLATLVLTLALAIVSRRWAWAVGLLRATAAAVLLLTVGADSRVAQTLVGSVLGFGCSWYWREVARSFAPLLVAVCTTICLMTEGDRSETSSHP